MDGFVGKVKHEHQVEIFAMSNLHAPDTGISGAVVFVSSGEFEGKQSQHGPRLKVMIGNKVTSEALETSVVVTLTDPPRILGDIPAPLIKKISAFVLANLETLLKYWKFEITTREMLDGIKKIS